MAALVNTRAAVRLLGSASLRGDAVGRRGLTDLSWASMRGESGRTGGARGARRRVARGGAPLREGDGVPRSALGAARGAREQRRAWRAGADTHDQQQPTTTSLRLTQRQRHVRQQDAPRVFPATRMRWMRAAAIGCHVQNTGFSGGSKAIHWQGEWPGRAGVRRQGSSAGFVIDRALSHTQTPYPSDENRQTPLE
jgi:hypothetical protein